MSYRMILYTKNNIKIISPIIVPNNPKADYGDKSIEREIHKTGRSMLRFKLIKNYEVDYG